MPPRTLDALAYMEAGFRANRGDGFDAARTVSIYRLLASYSLGAAIEQLRSPAHAAVPAAAD